MSESLTYVSEKVGMMPGTLVHVGSVFEAETKISLVDYNKDTIEENNIFSIEELIKYKETDTITWVNVEGLKNVEIIESIGQMFHIHSLVLEDILNTHQRPKFQEEDEYIYIVIKSLALQNEKLSVSYEQISFLILDNFVFTFRETSDDLFSPIYQQLKNSKGRLRSRGSDYLAYAILDVVTDMNFVLIDSLDIVIDSIEDELLTNPTSQTLVKIQQYKRELINIRRSVSPLRELLSGILRSDSTLIRIETHEYFRDIYEHVIHVSEEIDSYKDILAGLLDIYISSVSNKMNEVMKVLTVFASIFIPLTFIAGVYGMNFEYMPELKWKLAYPVLWVFFIIFSIMSFVYFKKKKWI
ncbi:MAG: magnesium and cobalt transport protein CorA [Sulfurimonas sp. RIFOXYD12_FULL_33_39]|uniref:magnesium/cobalt transporter CorA n=1 Tax=unclassified Sulfurimonas TaxID=2623549 RepID=UPI0008C5FC61|nr:MULTISPECIES: magnesium/cobalt transporter CorA [unclassified Sulfurimonas]OHE09083.1 MAG: magnesium and cobalt transport protein CorA [Sulfurimonas sp. RIFOXYD12_FULL_33_39]OHE14400.1 MAG: magnesium and cobalt transport protein CorA [Sulfurimonas sp. RIFOXYD2_FULL_34_21]